MSSGKRYTEEFRGEAVKQSSRLKNHAIHNWLDNYYAATIDLTHE